MKNGSFLSRVSPYILLTLGTFFAFWPCLSARFLNWDDQWHFFENPQVLSAAAGSLWDAWRYTPDIASVYMPLTIFSFALEYRFFGADPFISHLINIMLHAAAACAVFSLGKRMGVGVTGALMAAAIFAVHPMRVESVAWVSERKDVLFGVFYVAAMGFFWEYLRTDKAKYYIAALVCSGLSLLAKPMAVSLPFVLFLLEWMSGRKFSLKSFLDKIPFAAVFIPLGMVTASGHAYALAAPASTYSWSIVIWKMLLYIKKFFIVIPVPTLHEAPLALDLFWAWGWLAGLLAATYFLRRNRWWIFSFLFFICTIFFMVRGEIVDLAKGVIQERYMYIPCIGFCFFLGDLADRSALWWKRSWICSLLVIVLLAGMTFDRCFAWQDSYVFWSDVLQRDKDNTFALINRAACLIDEKEVRARYGFTETEAYLMAVKDLQTAVKRAPRDADAWRNLAIAHRRLGQKKASMSAFDRYMQLQ